MATQQDQWDRQAFTDWLRERVEERGYALDGRSGHQPGQSQLAADSGVVQSVLSRLLSGSGKGGPPRMATLVGLARALNMDPVEMLERAGRGEDAQRLRAARREAVEQSEPDKVLDRIESSGLPEPIRRELAANYRRRLISAEEDVLSMLAALHDGIG